MNCFLPMEGPYTSCKQVHTKCCDADVDASQPYFSHKCLQQISDNVIYSLYFAGAPCARHCLLSFDLKAIAKFAPKCSLK